MERKEIFGQGTFSLGVNYRASHAATRMGSQRDAEVVEKDLKNLAENGCEMLRFFLIWPDFQPIIKKQLSFRNSPS